MGKTGLNLNKSPAWFKISINCKKNFDHLQFGQNNFEQCIQTVVIQSILYASTFFLQITSLKLCLKWHAHAVQKGFLYFFKKMAELGKQYESVCSTKGKQNFVQPYMWIGVEDPEGKGVWRDMYDKNKIEFAPWDMVMKQSLTDFPYKL